MVLEASFYATPPGSLTSARRNGEGSRIPCPTPLAEATGTINTRKADGQDLLHSDISSGTEGTVEIHRTPREDIETTLYAGAVVSMDGTGSPRASKSTGQSPTAVMTSPTNLYGPVLRISSIAEELIMGPKAKSEPFPKYTEAYVSGKVFHPRIIRDAASSDEREKVPSSADTSSPVSSQPSPFKIPRKPVPPSSQSSSEGGPVCTVPLRFEQSQFEHFLCQHPSADGNIIQTGITKTSGGGFVTSEGKQTGILGELRRVLSGLTQRRGPKLENEAKKAKSLTEEQVKENQRAEQREKLQKKVAGLKGLLSDSSAVADLISSPSPSLESTPSAIRSSEETAPRTSAVNYHRSITQLNKSCTREVRGCVEELARRLVQDENLERRKGWYRVSLLSPYRQI